jgi:hypothetical protein
MPTYNYRIIHHGSYNEKYHGKIFKINATNLKYARMNIGKTEGIILGNYEIDVWPESEDESTSRKDSSSNDSGGGDVLGALVLYGAGKLAWMAGKGLKNLFTFGLKSYQDYKKNKNKRPADIVADFEERASIAKEKFEAAKNRYAKAFEDRVAAYKNK